MAPRWLAYGGPAGEAPLTPIEGNRARTGTLPPMDSPTGSPLMDRRKFLAVAGVGVASIYLVGCGGSSSSAPAAPSLAEAQRFITVSVILTGVEHLPAAPAAAYLTALNASGLTTTPSQFITTAFGNEGAPESMSDLTRMGATALPGADDCMRSIAATWWSGIVTNANGTQEVVSFTDALVFTKVHAFTTCYGAPGAGQWRNPGEHAA